MKNGFWFLAALGLALTGCTTYQGGTATDSDVTYGTAADMRSPSGMDRAKGTNQFNTLPPAAPEGSGARPQYPDTSYEDNQPTDASR